MSPLDLPQEGGLKVYLVVPRVGCFWLHQIIGLLTGHTFLNQGQHSTLAEYQTKCRVHVADHVFWEDCQILDNISKTVEHVVNQNSRIWCNDVAQLMSERYHVRARELRSHRQ